MSKKLILVFVLLFFFRFNFAFAGNVIIDEFVSDPSDGPEWIELLNTSSSAVDLNGWAWTELASPGSDKEHESSPKNLSGVISPGGVFVFETNSALNNAGDSIGLYNGTNLEDRVTYGKVNSYTKDLDVPAKGKSGAYINGEWQTNQEPTKNMQNPNTSSSSGDNAAGGGEASPSTFSKESTTKSKVSVATQKIKVEITAPSLVYANVPFSIEGKVFGTTGEQLDSGEYYWNFGDGGLRETKVLNVDKFNHTYYYPGEYVLLLEHHPDFFTVVPDATEKLIIKVVMPEIYLSSVGNENDFFVEITNNANYDADLSGWYLLSSQKSFLIPRNTILTAKNKITLSPLITHFSFEDKNTLKLMTPAGEVAFDYALQRTLIKTAPRNTVSLINSSYGSLNTNTAAAVIGSNVSEDKKVTLPILPILPILPVVSFVFIGASASAVYFIRRKRYTKEPGSDFEILDE